MAPRRIIAPLLAAGEDIDHQLGLGPLRLASQSPGQSLRLGLEPHAASTLPAGRWDVSVGSTWINQWADAAHYQLDFEAVSSQLVVGYGAGEHWQVEAALASRETFGGDLDGLIIGFHRAFGLDQDGRDRVPRGRTVVHIDATATQPGIDLAADDLERQRKSGARLTVMRSLADGIAARPACALAVSAQAPVGASRRSGGLRDAGVELITAQRIGAFVGYLTGAYTRFGANRIEGVRLHRSNWSGLAAVEWRVSRRGSLVLQYLVSEGVAPDYYVFSRPSHELTLGAKAASAATSSPTSAWSRTCSSSTTARMSGCTPRSSAGSEHRGRAPRKRPGGGALAAMLPAMDAFLETFLAFFFLLTPFFVLSVFLGLTATWQPARRRALAVRTAVAVLAICLVLFSCGNRLFSVLGITLDAFRVGAGALLFLAAARMVQGVGDAPREEASGEALAVVPLAIPITVGPGTTGALLVLGAETHGVQAVLVRCGALAAAVVAVGLILLAGDGIRRALGVAGMAIFSRLSGLFLAALAAQLVLTGARNVLAAPG